METSATNPKFCAICGDRSDGYHFDQPSCRACAAFFRRTVSHNLKYSCRRDGNCQIEKEVRNSCRACRYQKCLHRGMLTSAVKGGGLPKIVSESNIINNGNNGNIGTATLQMTAAPLASQSTTSKMIQIVLAVDPSQLLLGGQGQGAGGGGEQLLQMKQIFSSNPSSNSNVSELVASPQSNCSGSSYNFNFSEAETTHAPRTTIVHQQPAVLHHPSPVYANASVGTTLLMEQPSQQQQQQQFGSSNGGGNLERMLQGYHQMQSVKKAAYSAVADLGPEEADGLYRSHFDNFKKTCKLLTNLCYNMVDRFFWPFGELPAEDKLKLFGPFFQLYCNSSRAFRSHQKFPPGDDRLFMPDGGYIHLSQLDQFFDHSQMVLGKPEEAARLFKNTGEYLMNNVVAYMRDIDMQELELMALFGVMLWTDSPELSPETLSQVRLQRKCTIVDLHRHYRGMGIVDEEITLKTANLFLLIPKLETVVKMMLENATINDLFNILTIEEACRHHAIV